MKLIDIELKDIKGSLIDWTKYDGKKILFVNVASECGFTPQYAQLQELYDQYQDKLEIIGLPCNDFGGQEPGNANEIQSFCSVNYGVSFTISEKVGIKNDTHPIIEYLCAVRGETVDIDWNFNKFLVNEQKEVIQHHRSSVSPLSEAILSHFS